MARIIDKVNKYYSDKIRKHGSTPQGVDWNSEESQHTRFNQLLKIVKGKDPFSINDLGCGYGALLPHLIESDHRAFDYTGYDISAEMIAAAKKQATGLGTESISIRFQQMHDASEMSQSDYSTASGIFNVRLDNTDQQWLEYILTTLDGMAKCSRSGFSFNCLTQYSDSDRMRDYLYYADPCFLFDHCKEKYSRDVALLHDYGLYEFTILVRTPHG